MFFVDSSFEGLWGALFSHIVTKLVVYFGLYESSLYSTEEKEMRN